MQVPAPMRRFVMQFLYVPNRIETFGNFNLFFNLYWIVNSFLNYQNRFLGFENIRSHTMKPNSEVGFCFIFIVYFFKGIFKNLYAAPAFLALNIEIQSLEYSLSFKVFT